MHKQWRLATGKGCCPLGPCAPSAQPLSLSAAQGRRQLAERCAFLRTWDLAMGQRPAEPTNPIPVFINSERSQFFSANCQRASAVSDCGRHLSS